MSKDQINYLLALATLLVCWLYFNTFFCGAKKNCAMGPGGGMMTASMGRYPNPMGMQNIQQPPNITELLRNQARNFQPPAAPGTVPSVPSKASQTDKAANS